MDDESQESSNPVPGDYPVWFKLLALLSALLAVGIILLFGFLGLIALSDSAGAVGLLSLLAAAAEGLALYRAGSLYASGKAPMSTLVLWGAVMLIGIPFVAFWGCVLVYDLPL
jgi:uncharacterized membrane-anchored protein